MSERPLDYSTIDDLIEVPKSNLGVERNLSKVGDVAHTEGASARKSARRLKNRLYTHNPLPAPVAYVTGITLAVDEILHDKRPITHIQGRVSAYAYAIILKSIDYKHARANPAKVAAPAKLQRLKTFRVSNTRIYAVALVDGNHRFTTDCYSMTFLYDGLKWIMRFSLNRRTRWSSLVVAVI